MKELTIDLVICTYNNADLLDQALLAMTQQVVPSWVRWQVLVVNNNCTDHTAAVVNRYQDAGELPHLRMVYERTQGLTPARQCGVANTAGEWIAFVDDDCFLEKDWVEKVAVFAQAHPDCSGLGGKVNLVWEEPPEPWVLNFAYSFAQQDHGAVAKRVSCLVGAGMVIRRSALLATHWQKNALLEDRIGDQLISGGDVEIALRLAAQAPLWYSPDIQLKHFIPSDRTTVQYLMRINYGLGVSKFWGDSMVWAGSYAALLISALRELGVGIAIAQLAGLKARLKGQPVVPHKVTMSFMRGYGAAIRRMIRMNDAARQKLLGRAVPLSTKPDAAVETATETRWRIQNVYLDQDITGVAAQPGYTGVFVMFWWQNLPLGYREFSVEALPVSAIALSHIVAKTIEPTVNSYLEKDFLPPPPRIKSLRRKRPPRYRYETQQSVNSPLSKLNEISGLVDDAIGNSIDKSVTASTHLEEPQEAISVVICTRDRPKYLNECLKSLQTLVNYPAEVLVVDNAPTSHATRNVVQQYPAVRYILEPRPGLSIARNTGLRHATGDIVAFTDDDVIVHPRWLERIRYGFQDPAVMVVTGLMLPAELETAAQVAFHQGVYGFEWECRPLLYDAAYFKERRRFGTPVWQIGAGANMAIRRQVIETIGGFNELLGAGASGCSEDSEFWYRVLAAGRTCRYEPSAVIYHYHRGNLESLKKQQYAYMRGHVTALLIQAIQHRHWGNLFRLFVILPEYYIRLLLKGLTHRFSGKYRTVFVEIAGCFAGLLFFIRHYAANSSSLLKTNSLTDHQTNS